MTQNENKTLSRNRKLALTGAFSAIVVVLAFTRLGMIPLGAVASISILQVPIILITMLAGLGEGLFVGAVFGISSLILAATSPSGVLDPLFVNPLCSVLPRMLVAVVAWGVWKVLNLIPKMPKPVSAAINGFISTAAHTLLVIGSIYMFKGAAVKEAMGGIGYFALIGSLSFNAILEAIAATIICTAVYGVLFISGKNKSKLSESLEKSDSE